MTETWGALAAALSSALGGTAIGATRFLAPAPDPVTIGAIRFAGGFVALLPVALWRRDPWPPRSDWGGVLALGLMLFGLFPVLFNASVAYTTAARAALALSTLPLLTMAAAALLRVESVAPRKTVGVLIAMGGVAVALAAGGQEAPPGAWRGDLLMAAAALCVALYGVWSRPFIARPAPVPFAACGMGAGRRACSRCPAPAVAWSASPRWTRRRRWPAPTSPSCAGPSSSTCGPQRSGARAPRSWRCPSP